MNEKTCLEHIFTKMLDVQWKQVLKLIFRISIYTCIYCIYGYPFQLHFLTQSKNGLLAKDALINKSRFSLKKIFSAKTTLLEFEMKRRHFTDGISATSMDKKNCICYSNKAISICIHNHSENFTFCDSLKHEFSKLFKIALLFILVFFLNNFLLFHALGFPMNMSLV